MSFKIFLFYNSRELTVLEFCNVKASHSHTTETAEKNKLFNIHVILNIDQQQCEHIKIRTQEKYAIFKDFVLMCSSLIMVNICIMFPFDDGEYLLHCI